MTTIVRCLSPSLVLLFACAALAQSDFFPPVQAGGIVVQLQNHVTGLNDLVNGTNQFFGTKMVPLNDGSGRKIVSTMGGLLRIVDENGSFLDTPLGGTIMNTLPIGIQQRIVIARALVSDPAIVLFDNAHNGLDLESDNQLRNALIKLPCWSHPR